MQQEFLKYLLTKCKFSHSDHGAASGCKATFGPTLKKMGTQMKDNNESLGNGIFDVNLVIENVTLHLTPDT